MAGKWKDLYDTFSPDRKARVEARVEESMRAKPYQQLRDELFTPEQQMKNEERAMELLRRAAAGCLKNAEEEAVLEINTQLCDQEELREDFEKFIKRFMEEGANLRCELVTGVEGVRFVAVFNWDDMG